MSHRQNEVICSEGWKEEAVLFRLEKCERNRNTHVGAQVSLWRKLFPMKRLFGNFKVLSGNMQM